MRQLASAHAMRLRLLVGICMTSVIATTSAALAQPPLTEGSDVEALERLHAESVETRRVLGDSVLIAGLASIAGGVVLIVPKGDDQAWRYAGINTALFGAINTVVGLLALAGISREKQAWESAEARADRRTPEGLVRARNHAMIDERRESVGQAVNLGLDCAYLAVAGTAILASQLGADHPNRWLASGVAIGVQAAFLIGVDFFGLRRSAHYHRAIVESVAPSFSIVPAGPVSELRFGFGGAF